MQSMPDYTPVVPLVPDYMQIPAEAELKLTRSRKFRDWRRRSNAQRREGRGDHCMKNHYKHPMYLYHPKARESIFTRLGLDSYQIGVYKTCTMSGITLPIQL